MAARKFSPKGAAVVDLMSYSRHGAMSQLFIVDAVQKAFKPTPQHKARETNEDLIKRLLRYDEAATVQAVETAAQNTAGAGLEKVRAAFAKSGADGMINPDAWHGVAVEIRDKLAAKS